tara:strand:+ start:985 stop:1416 length:432 start_codon:yes stop_codon:yes gene_type:complete
MSLNYKIWLPHLFFTLETIAILYPLNPNKTTVKKYYNLVQNLPVYIPLNPIGSYFLSLLDKYPLQPYLSSRMSFMKWVFFIKKKIYKKFDMDIYDFYENLEIYYKEYRPKDKINQDEKNKKRKYIQASFVLILLVSIYYFYNK